MLDVRFVRVVDSLVGEIRCRLKFKKRILFGRYLEFMDQF